MFSNLRHFGQVARELWATLSQRNDVRKALSWSRYALFAAIVLYLLFQLGQVGWTDVLQSLPTSPWFYLFFMLRFFALPISELAIYEIIWSTSLVRHFLVFIRKRVYNFAVMGYSGEAFLTLWARRNLQLSDKTILVGIKDNNLLSAFSSNAATVILVVILALTGSLGTTINAFPGAGLLFTLAFLSALTLAVLVAVFRRKLIAVPPRILPKLLGVHGGRQVLIILLHAAMYASALPGAPLMAWITFIALQLVLSRIPFLPNQDFVYLSAALALSPIVGASEALVAGMLVAEAGLSQLFNAIMFIATSHLARVSYKPA